MPIAGVLCGDRRPTRAVLTGTIAGLALLAKSFALALLPWIVLAYGYQAWRERDRWKQSVGCLVIAAAVMVAVGGGGQRGTCGAATGPIRAS